VRVRLQTLRKRSMGFKLLWALGELVSRAGDRTHRDQETSPTDRLADQSALSSGSMRGRSQCSDNEKPRQPLRTYYEASRTVGSLRSLAP